MSESIGVLFAATGEDYVALAERAARSVKAACPGLEVDLFTDRPVDMPVFDRVEILDDPWRRARIDAMMQTRFDRTLHLDADLFVVADIRDVFEVLDRFDMAMAHDPSRNGETCQTFWRKPLPNAFPQFNGGVIAYRRSPEVIEFLKSWSRTVRENDLKRDQPVLRELIWDSDLRVATLPREYNLTHFGMVRLWWTSYAAPRIIHSPQLHQHFTMNRKRIETLEQLVGPVVASKLPLLLAADRGLARMAGREPRMPDRADIWRRRLRLLRDVPVNWIRRRVGRG